MSSIDKNCYLLLQDRVMAPKLHLCPCLVIWWPSLLTLKLSEMLDTVAVSLFQWQKLPPGTLNGVMESNCNFAHIWSYGEHSLRPLDLKFSEMLNTAPISLSDWQKFLTGAFKLRYGSKTVVFTIFGHVVTRTFDLWTSDFQKCLTLPQ